MWCVLPPGVTQFFAATKPTTTLIWPLNIHMIKLNPNILRFSNFSSNIYIIIVLQSARYGDPHVHEIDRVHPQHEGVYTCVVGNGKINSRCGSISRNIRIYSISTLFHLFRFSKYDLTCQIMENICATNFVRIKYKWVNKWNLIFASLVNDLLFSSVRLPRM